MCLALFLYLLVCSFPASVVLAASGACDCTNIKCPPEPNCHGAGRVLDQCGCCSVCERTVGEVCGGNNDIFGRCKAGFDCVTNEEISRGSFRIGVCHISKGTRSGDEGTCDPSDRTYVERTDSTSRLIHCYEVVCDNATRVSSIPLRCTEIGCGITRSLEDICCSVCKPDKVQVHCSSGMMQVLMPKSLMTKAEFNASSLNDKRCLGFEIRQSFVFETSVYSCGTIARVKSKSSFNFSNRIRINRKGPFGSTGKTLMSFVCTYKRRLATTAIYRVRQDIVKGIGKSVGLYFTKQGRLLKSRKLRVARGTERMDVSISSLIPKKYNLNIEVNSCYLSSLSDMTTASGVQHYFIKNGCPINNRVQLRLKIGHAIWYSFDINNLTDLPKDKLYFHCDVVICSKRSKNVKCRRRCAKQRKLINGTEQHLKNS